MINRNYAAPTRAIENSSRVLFVTASVTFNQCTEVVSLFSVAAGYVWNLHFPSTLSDATDRIRHFLNITHSMSLFYSVL